MLVILDAKAGGCELQARLGYIVTHISKTKQTPTHTNYYTHSAHTCSNNKSTIGRGVKEKKHMFRKLCMLQKWQ